MKKERGIGISLFLILISLCFLWETTGELLNAEEKSMEHQNKLCYPLRFHLDSDVVTSLGWIQLKRAYRQKSNEMIVIEAEDSTFIKFHSNDMTPNKSSEASGGYYVDHVTEIGNQIFIQHPTEYHVWYRAYFPAQGNWNHAEQMDDGFPQNVEDSLNGPVKEWLWVKGPVYQLTKGWHTYLFPAPTAWCGGARLDKIVLSPKNTFQPAGIGPLISSPIEIPPKADFVSNQMRLDEAVNWALDYEIEENGGMVKVEYSYDQGKTWEPIEKNKLYPVTPQNIRVTFRFLLIRSCKDTSPRIRNAVITLYE